MKHSSFFHMFVEFIQDLYDAENQIVKALPEMIQKATQEDLKKALSNHLQETKEQVNRLKQIFSLLGEKPMAKPCKAIKGLIAEGSEVLEKRDITPIVRDAFIIVAGQKIEHYEISSYGSACTLAKHLSEAYEEEIDFEQICDLLNETLKEEGAADKKLTSIAEGNVFKKGVNDEAETEVKMHKSR